jgi:cell division protein ZapA
MSRVVHVHIHGQQYAVRSDLDPQYISELSAYLDEKMRLAAREIASADVTRVAVIAALNVADDLFRARTATPADKESLLLTRAAEIERLVDAVLQEDGVAIGSPLPKAAAGG